MYITEKDVGRRVITRGGEEGQITEYIKSTKFPVKVCLEQSGFYAAYAPDGAFLPFDSPHINDLVRFVDEEQGGGEMRDTYSKDTLTKEVLEGGVMLRVLSEEHSEAFQNACFALGASWRGGQTSAIPVKEGYFIIVSKMGTEYLWLSWGCPKHGTERIPHREIFFSVEKDKEMKYEPFDLKRALEGEPVVTRDGREVSQVALFECSSKRPLVAVVDSEIYSFAETGRHSISDYPSRLDLFMKPKTHIVNGFEVPAPVKEPLNDFDDYYMPIIQVDDFYLSYDWSGDSFDKMYLERGLVFLRKEDAIANAKAMLGINPYGEEGN